MHLLRLFFLLCGVHVCFSQKTVSSEQKIRQLHSTVKELWQSAPHEAMQRGKEAYRLSKERKDSTLISESLRLTAAVHFHKGDYNESLELNMQALDIALALKDSSLIGNSYNNLGLLYINLGDYQTALEYLLQAKMIKEKIDDSYGRAALLNNIGLVYHGVENFETANDYFVEGYKVANKSQNSSFKLYSVGNLGQNYLHRRALDSALYYFTLGMRYGEEINNINWRATFLQGIGEVYGLQERDSSTYYLKGALALSRQIEDKKGITQSYYLLAKQAFRNNQLTDALKYIQLASDWSHQTKIKSQQLDNLKLCAKIYSRLGDTQMENTYLKRFSELQSELFSNVVIRNLDYVPLKIREEEDRMTLSKQQIELKNKNLTNRIFAFIIIIIIPFFIFTIILIRKNDKKNKELEASNKEIKRAQKMLVSSEKMASLGILAAGIGHEINNPLNFIKNGVEALKSKVKNNEINKPEDAETLLKIIDEGVSRATNIVKSLSHFSRKGNDQNEACNVNDIIGNCLLILHSKIRNRVRVITHFEKNPGVVLGSEGRLHQVIMNFIANAEQAIEETGTITITTKREGEWIYVEIKDDGSGISEEDLSKIGDPFFTTKPPGKGTGLGLFISFSIIEEHGGSIDVDSEKGVGTCFRIHLPLQP